MQVQQTSITQLGVCSVTIRHKNIGKLCGFFVVLGGTQHSYGQKEMEVIDTKCSTIESRRYINEINEQSTQGK